MHAREIYGSALRQEFGSLAACVEGVTLESNRWPTASIDALVLFRSAVGVPLIRSSLIVRSGRGVFADFNRPSENGQGVSRLFTHSLPPS